MTKLNKHLDITLNWPTLNLIALIALLSLGQLQRVQLTPGIAVYGHDILIAITLLITSRDLIPQSVKGILQSPKVLLSLGWIGLGLVAATIGGEPVHLAGLRLARLAAYGLYSWQVWQWHPQRVATTTIKLLFLLLGGLIASWGLLQYLLVPDTRFLATIGWDNHYYRLISTWLDPAFTGHVLVLATIWGWDWIVDRRLQLGYTWLMTLSLALTYSRSSYLSFLVAAGGYLVYKYTRSHLSTIWLPILLGASIILTGPIWLPTPPGEGTDLTRTASITARQDNIIHNLTQLSPLELLIGRGLFVPVTTPTTTQAQLTITNHAVVPDNIIVLLVAGLGLGGTLLLLVVWKKELLTTWSQHPVWSILLISTVVHSMFNHTLFHPLIFLSLLLTKPAIGDTEQ